MIRPAMYNHDSSSLIEVERATVRFGPLLAVRDVSFKLAGGELLGLIGPNGAGKTTLLRAVAGLQPLTAGTIRVMGEPVTVEDRAGIGFTPDTPAFYDALTVRDFLRFIAKGYRLNAAEATERIGFWLEKVWLADKADQKISALSRGMRQRVGIARTLIPNPHVVLLDEPAAGIDPAGRVQFRQLLCDLRQQGKALIVSSHILSDMEDYCSHVGIMSKGKLTQIGTVAEIAHGVAAGSARRRYRVSLARPIDKVTEAVSTLIGGETVAVHDGWMTFEYSNHPDDAAELLARLVGAGLPIAAFMPEAVDLEAAYLRTGIEQVD